MEFIRLEAADSIAALTIHRPKALNALNQQVLRALHEALTQVSRDTSVRVLLITGEGDKAFVAGADIAEMAHYSTSQALEFSQMGQRALALLEALSIPTIAAVNGFALGGGCELALACDFIYASEKAKFGLPEVTLGVIPGFGGTQRATRLLGLPRAKELILTGNVVDAEQAKAMGLVLDVLRADDLLPHCKKVAGEIAKRAPLAVAQAKRVIHNGMTLPFDAACELECQAFAQLFATADQREGMKAFAEKRTAQFKGE